ncbi:dihydrolipoyl dehydrogenase [bacterium]|nr:dihydrolipoyl dehydrogenase [bacterium]
MIQTPVEKCDIVVLGSGTAGYSAALSAARLGASVTVIESRETGGTCLNRGCIPTKALIGSLEAFEKAKRAASFGFSAGTPVPDWPAMQARKKRIVGQLVGGVEKLLSGSGVRLVRGRATLDGPLTVLIRGSEGGETRLAASRAVIVATGSEPARPAIFPFDGVHVITSDEALELEAVPESLLVVGAGAVGVEFSRVFASLGSRVVMVEMADRILPGMDGRAGQTLAAAMGRRGVRIHAGAAVRSVAVRNGRCVTELADGRAEETEQVLVCTGRTPNTAGLGLEAAGATLERGYLRADETGRTSAAGLYAAGDVAGKWLLAYTAAREGIRAAEHAMGRPLPPDVGPVPVTVFSDPEVASVGLTAEEAGDRGIGTKTGRFLMAALGKAAAVGETEGFVALVADAATERILGGQAVGPHASELIAEIALAVRLGLTAGDVAGTLHSHPTLAEAVCEAAHDVRGECLHKLRR